MALTFISGTLNSYAEKVGPKLNIRAGAIASHLMLYPRDYGFIYVNTLTQKTCSGIIAMNSARLLPHEAIVDKVELFDNWIPLFDKDFATTSLDDQSLRELKPLLPESHDSVLSELPSVFGSSHFLLIATTEEGPLVLSYAEEIDNLGVDG